MDEDEDFRALYFAECQDLVEDLQNHLSQILDGQGDEESIHAAFRAVHSVKGGAAAFGFNELIDFAHTFEAVMDLARSHQLEMSTPLCELLLRAGDTMESLIVKARDEDEAEIPNLKTVRGELEKYLGVESEPEPEPAVTTDVAEPKVEPETASEPEDDLPEEKTFVVMFRPMDTFLESGFDMLKIVDAARELGLTDLKPIGDVLPLPEFGFDKSTIDWRMTFETERSKEDLASFFMIYEAAAEFEFEETAGEEAASEPEVAPSPPADTPGQGDATTNSGPKAETEAGSATMVERKEPAARPAARPPEKKSTHRNEGKSLRVDLERVDRLVNLVGEIAITQASLVQTFSESEMSFDASLEQTIDSLSRQTRDLQDSVMAIRAQPVKVVFSRMPRVVRELCDQLGKKVKLEIEGELTEVDTTIIEELSEPLIHMLRNSMDHGIEAPETRTARGKPEVGRILLKAEHRGERVMITISDDGAGINREAVAKKAYAKGLIAQDEKLSPEEIDNLIFHPGFSTAEKVSSVSGRGVGMDVVRKKIVELGGRCTLRNEPGQGCVFTIALPLTLAVLDGMTISVGGERFILPLSSVVEATFLKPEDVRRLPDGSEVLARRGEYIKLLSVRRAFSISGGREAETMAVIVDTETDGHVALRVDELLGQRQVVLKSIESNYRRVDGVSGATILGDGRVALIIDVPALIELAARAGAHSTEMYH